MKTISPILIIIVTTLLSGCAHYVGYQRSYAGYGSAYRTPGYYAYPSTSYYYQSSPIIYYDRHYTSPRPYGYRDFNHRDWNRHRYDKHKDWRPSKQRNYAPHWKPNNPPRHEHERQRSISRPMELHRNFPDNRKESRRHSDQGRTRNEGHGRSEGHRRGN